MSLVIAMIDVESTFRPNVVSATDDYGLMQINKCNHNELEKQYGITNILDPYQNVRSGIILLSKNYNGDLHKSLMAYNLGTGGAKRLWNKGIYETSYSRKVLSTMEVYENEIK
jgi:soluble lytic murein transglycosylase-like protein